MKAKQIRWGVLIAAMCLVMFDIGSREQFDVYQSLGVAWDLESLIFGTMTAAQFRETYRQEFQAAIDAYFG